ncbi:hypothetical protein [Flavobacterium sp.]|uniref:hypothetical protein n=1 Tax=Flavobacterium sp. TaxID=239 RepID=UPI0037520903
MTDLNSYFTEENIIKLLCKYRANEANKRHAKHMIRNVSLHKSTNKVLITDEQENFKFLQKLFPSRRDWKKLNEIERKTYVDTLSINRKRLYKSYETAKREVDTRGGIPAEWYKQLIDFVNEIKDDIDNIEISSFIFSKPDILGIKKEIKHEIIEGVKHNTII